MVKILFLAEQALAKAEGTTLDDKIDINEKLITCLEKDYQMLPEMLEAEGMDIGELTKWVDSLDLETFEVTFEVKGEEELNLIVLEFASSDCLTEFPIQ